MPASVFVERLCASRTQTLQESTMALEVARDIAQFALRTADHAPSMLAYWDAQMKCRFANRAHELRFGLGPEGLVGMSIADMLGPQAFALSEPYIRAALRGESQQFERVVTGPDGERRQSLVTYTPDVVDGQVLGFVAQITDVSPLKRVQGQLQETIATLEDEIRRRRTVEESLVDTQKSLAVTLTGIGKGFLATNREGRVTLLNESAQLLLGWTEEQARGRLLGEVFVRDDQPSDMPDRNPIDVILEQQSSAETAHEAVVITADGRRTPVEFHTELTHSEDGSVRGLAIAIRDLSQLKAAEAGRDFAENRFRLVFEASSSALLMLDRSQRIVLLNHRAEQLFGYRREDLLGQTVDQLLPESARAEHLGQVTRFFERPHSRAMSARNDLFARRKDGREVAVEIGLDPIQMQDGLYTLASLVDITQRKHDHDELRRSNAELEQFAYIASHDLQEPLRMVASYTELLAQRYKGRLDEKADKYIFYAVDGAKRMQRLVADLLAFSRVGSQGKPLIPVAVDAIVARATEALQASIRESGARVEAQGLPTVLGDEIQLVQLFQNLIANAVKFRSEAAPHIIIRALRKRDRWVFEVKDNAIGIEMQYAERIFLMFQRLHERGTYEGSGIGLAIVKRIVERHEGTIWVESEPGHGTSFFFTLAAADAGSAAP
jgi:PAS domain S-box-containing protein